MVVRNGYGMFVKIFLYNKVVIDFFNKNGESLLDIVKRNGMEDIIKFFMEVFDMNNEDFIKKYVEKLLVMVRSYILGLVLFWK